MGKKKRDHSSGTAALRILDSAGVVYKLSVKEHAENIGHGYALATAEKLGLDPETVFKTLMAQVDGTPVCAVVSAIGVLNLKSLAKAAGGKKAEMLEPHKAEQLTGYVTGGISPLGQKKRFPTFIDVSAQALSTMNVSGGKRSLSVELSPEDLAMLTDAIFAPIMDKRRHF